MQAEKPEHKPKRKNKAHSYRTRFMVIIGCVLLLAGAIVYFLPQLFPVHLKISNIESVRIDNSWSGLARGAPFISNFDLTMQNGMLMGTAKFASGYDYSSDGNLVETHGSVMIPREVVEEFLDILREVRLVEGVYVPLVEWTDDYPNISIVIQTDSEIIEIFTGSQGQEHNPWGARIQGKEYIIASGIPAQALSILEPYLIENFPETMGEASNYSP